jgi:hypothetical protein
MEQAVSSVDRAGANVFRVFVAHPHAAVEGRLMTCVEVGWPKGQEPHDQVLQAARFCEQTAIGTTLEVVEPNAVGRRLVTGGNVAFRVQQGMPAWWPVGEVMQKPLVIGFTEPERARGRKKGKGKS